MVIIFPKNSVQLYRHFKTKLWCIRNTILRTKLNTYTKIRKIFLIWFSKFFINCYQGNNKRNNNYGLLKERPLVWVSFYILTPHITLYHKWNRTSDGNIWNLLLTFFFHLQYVVDFSIVLLTANRIAQWLNFQYTSLFGAFSLISNTAVII